MSDAIRMGCVHVHGEYMAAQYGAALQHIEHDASLDRECELF